MTDKIFDGTLPSEGAVYAVGNFDGVHIAHRRLFHICKALSRGGQVCAVTFEGLTRGGGRLTSSEERRALLTEAGADHVLTVDFSRVRDITAEDFATRHLAALSPRALVCGENFRFGRGGAGDAALLRELLEPRGIGIEVAETLTLDGSPVSTTRIKAALSAGDAAGAAKMLGRRYSVTLPVTGGKRLGRRMGTPTANQHFPEGMFIPRHGVYATAVAVDGRILPGVTNIGVRPTVDDGDGVTAETFIPDFSGDLYGLPLRVEFLEYLREEKKFSSTEELAHQIMADGRRAKEILAQAE